MPEENSKNKVTMRQLAEQCKCSLVTIHRALNRSQEESHVGPKLYQKIHRLAQKTGYRPNYHFRSFYSGRSDRIGYLMGSYSTMIGSYVFDGISDVFASTGKSLEVLVCRNHIPTVCKTLDQMLYRGCDGLVYWPPSPLASGDQEQLREILQKYQPEIPILILGSDCDLHGANRLLIPGRELGREAALRQLEAGCRKFGIMQVRLPHSFDWEAAKEYRDTLRQNGVPEKNIREVTFCNQTSAEQFESLREIDGVWCYHYTLLHAYRNILKQMWDLSKIHIDCTVSVDNMCMIHWNNDLGRSLMKVLEERSGLFASMKLHFYSYYALGELAAQRIQTLIQSPADVPPLEYLPMTDDVTTLLQVELPANGLFRENIDTDSH